jgi:putative peptidoglycan lipid II flippase
MPFLMRLRVLPRPKLDWRHDGVKKILLLMLPALFGVSVSQVNLLLDSVIASFLGDGPVSWLYYSDRLTELPLGVFAIAIATVITPTLSRQHASANAESFAITLDWAVRLIFLVALPATFALLILAEPILLTLFEGEKFDLNAVSNSSYSLRAYSLGLLAFMLIKVLAPGFFAQQDMKTPVNQRLVAESGNERAGRQIDTVTIIGKKMKTGYQRHKDDQARHLKRNSLAREQDQRRNGQQQYRDAVSVRCSLFHSELPKVVRSGGKV